MWGTDLEKENIQTCNRTGHNKALRPCIGEWWTPTAKSTPDNGNHECLGERTMSYLGVDLHTNSFTVCHRTKQGKQRIATYAIDRMDRFCKTLRKRDDVAVEATGNTAWFVE